MSQTSYWISLFIKIPLCRQVFHKKSKRFVKRLHSQRICDIYKVDVSAIFASILRHPVINFSENSLQSNGRCRFTIVSFAIVFSGINDRCHRATIYRPGCLRRRVATSRRDVARRGAVRSGGIEREFSLPLFRSSVLRAPSGSHPLSFIPDAFEFTSSAPEGSPPLRLFFFVSAYWCIAALEFALYLGIALINVSRLIRKSANGSSRKR